MSMDSLIDTVLSPTVNMKEELTPFNTGSSSVSELSCGKSKFDKKKSFFYFLFILVFRGLGELVSLNVFVFVTFDSIHVRHTGRQTHTYTLCFSSYCPIFLSLLNYLCKFLNPSFTTA